MSFFDLLRTGYALQNPSESFEASQKLANTVNPNPLVGLAVNEGDVKEAAKEGYFGILPAILVDDEEKKDKDPLGLSPEEVKAIIKDQFGEGTYQSRALDALPGILQGIQDQRTAFIPGVPSIQNLLGFNVQPTTGSTTPGLLNTLSTAGMNQIQSGQSMNPTIFKAKG